MSMKTWPKTRCKHESGKYIKYQRPKSNGILNFVSV